MSSESENFPTCFVIQAFDGGKYDLRYTETIRPALIAAGVDPQRADDILGLNPVIEKIESAIEGAAICIAEVTEDNPNVWLELGYALALRRPTVILCERDKRPKLPFDVQHRPVIFYSTESRSGYEALESEIVKHVKHEIATEQRVAAAPRLRPGSEASAGLEAYEVAILSTAFVFWPSAEGSVSHWELEKKLARDGYTDIGLALGVLTLIDRGLLLARTVKDIDDFGNAFSAKHYQVTPDGMEWVKSHKHLLEMHATPKGAKTAKNANFADMDDDIPF